MFSSRNRLVASAAIAWAALATGAAHADAIVVRSIGPSAKLYPPGRSVKDNATVALSAGDQLTLLDGQGTRTLKGPGNFNLANAPTPAASSRFADLVNARSTQRARVGAVRSMSAGPKHSPNIWFVDTAREGAMCVADPASVTLWRSDSKDAGTLTVKTAGGASAAVPFEAGSASAAWPANLPVAAGGSYALSWGGKPATTIRFALIGASAAGLEDTAASLIRNGCSAQLDLLVDVMSLPDASAQPKG